MGKTGSGCRGRADGHFHPSRVPGPPAGRQRQAGLGGSARAARRRLVKALRAVPSDVRVRLEGLAVEAARIRKRRDLIWFLLLDSMSTWGNSRGHRGLIEEPKNYQRVTFRQLKSLRPKARTGRLELVLRAAKVMWPARKAAYLSGDFDRIQTLGGVAAVKRTALGLKGRDAKIEFLQQFQGIGEKYARNCWMLLKDPDFEDCVALDSRIEKVERLLGTDRGGYAEREQALVEIAHDAGLSAWELDRILYNRLDWVLAALKR